MRSIFGNQAFAFAWLRNSAQDDSERRQELLNLEEAMREALHQKDVLELAYASGHWTEWALPVVNRITSVDIAYSAMDYDLATIPGHYNAGLGNFWLSRTPELQIRSVLNALHERISYGATVFMADQVHADWNGGELIQQSSNPYVLEDQLLEYFGPYTKELHLHMGKCFWYVIYEAFPCKGRRN